MAAKPLKWPLWLKRNGARLANSLLGPWLDSQQEQGERTPWVGWVVVTPTGWYLAGKGSVGRWDDSIKRWDYTPATTQQLEQAKVYQSRKAAVTKAKLIDGGKVQGVVHVLLAPEAP